MLAQTTRRLVDRVPRHRRHSRFDRMPRNAGQGHPRGRRDRLLMRCLVSFFESACGYPASRSTVGQGLKKFLEYGWNAALRGLVVILPIYLTTLLLLKAMKSLAGLVRPLARLLPNRLPAESILSFLLVLILCFLV